MFQIATGWTLETAELDTCRERSPVFELRSVASAATRPARTSGHRTFRHSLPLASITAATSVQSPSCTSYSSTKEPATGFEFPSECCVLGQTNCPVLFGTGVRSKKILGLKNIDVYALGLYVDRAAARKLLSKYKDTDPAELAKRQDIFDELAACGPYEKTLRLVVSFSLLRKSQFVSALKERIAPHVHEEADRELLERFKHQFDGMSLTRGLEVTFSDTGNGRLVTRVGGNTTEVVHSPTICRALFNIYLGPDAVSPGAKASFGKGLQALLQDSK